VNHELWSRRVAALGQFRVDDPLAARVAVAHRAMAPTEPGAEPAAHAHRAVTRPVPPPPTEDERQEGEERHQEQGDDQEQERQEEQPAEVPAADVDDGRTASHRRAGRTRGQAGLVADCGRAESDETDEQEGEEPAHEG